MRGVAIAACAALAPAALAGAPLDRAEVRRGMTAVGEQTSDQPAIRTERAGQPSAAFRIGAGFAAWRNAAAAVEFDAAHTTGDGGDAEALAIDCGDERIGFASVETARATAGASDAELIAAAGMDVAAATAWGKRKTNRPAACH